MAGTSGFNHQTWWDFNGLRMGFKKGDEFPLWCPKNLEIAELASRFVARFPTELEKLGLSWEFHQGRCQGWCGIFISKWDHNVGGKRGHGQFRLGGLQAAVHAAEGASVSGWELDVVWAIEMPFMLNNLMGFYGDLVNLNCILWEKRGYIDQVNVRYGCVWK